MASKAGEKTADGWNKQKTGSMPSLRDPFFFQGLHAQLLRHEKEFEDGQHFPPQNEQPTSSILSRFVANLGNRSAFEFSTYCIYIYIYISFIVVIHIVFLYNSRPCIFFIQRDTSLRFGCFTFINHLFGRFDRWSRHEFPTLPSGAGWRTSLGRCWSSQQFWARCTRTCTSCLEKL